MYQVEVRRDGNPATSLFEVYRWLADRKIQPGLCRHQIAGQTVTFRLSFAAASEADAFAAAFAGQKLLSVAAAQ